MFNNGDKIRLKKNFYEMQEFKDLPRSQRKDIASQKNRTLVYGSTYKNRASYSAENRGLFSIPIELLELVKKAEDTPKEGDLFRVIGNDGHHYHMVGDVVEFLETDSAGSYYTYCSETRKHQFVRKTDLQPLKPMTYAPHPEIKEGAKFVVVNPSRSLYRKGEIVSLYRNDTSSFPIFKSEKGDVLATFWDALAPLEPIDQKHRYTDEQIAEAELTIGKIVAGFGDYDSIFFPTVRDEKTTKVTMARGLDNPPEFGIAKCSPNDEFNQTIGRMVALCKVTGTELPEWM